jgi:hypothetical protein
LTCTGCRSGRAVTSCVSTARIYEAAAALRARRPPSALYHSALEVRLNGARYVIEMAPVWNERAPGRGVVAVGAVGSRVAGRLRLFRYEVRCWREGRIPDVAEAVDSPRRLASDAWRAQCVLDTVREVPTPVWGRDELRTGDMWNSNSVVSWLIVRCGLQGEPVLPPPGGRAPGWDAGLVIARRAHRPSAAGPGDGER